MDNLKKKEKTAVMTGATSGFGTVVAKELVRQNHRFIFLARSEVKANELILEMKKIHPDAKVEFVLCDLSSLDSVVEACAEIREKCVQIHLLVLNAGLWNLNYKESQNGIEETFQVNLLAPVLMFLKLFDLIPKNDRSKVIITASGLHQGTIQYDNIQFREKYSGFKAYRQSKLGVILISRLLAKLPAYAGISFYSVHPGVVSTQIGRNAGWLSRTIFKLIGSSVEKGARTHLYLINTGTSELTSGEYYAKSKVTKTSKESYDLKDASQLLGTIKKYIEPFY